MHLRIAFDLLLLPEPSRLDSMHISTETRARRSRSAHHSTVRQAKQAPSTARLRVALACRTSKTKRNAPPLEADSPRCWMIAAGDAHDLVLTRPAFCPARRSMLEPVLMLWAASSSGSVRGQQRPTARSRKVLPKMEGFRYQGIGF